jgi:hypothetical protein
MSCDLRFDGPNSQCVARDPRTAPGTTAASTANRAAVRFTARKPLCDFSSCKLVNA